MACALGGLASSAGAVGPLGFFFIDQAMQSLGVSAFGVLGFTSGKPKPGTPSWEATQGAAELLNEKLPIESGDGFSFIVARAPAPAALEIKAVAPHGSNFTSEQLDLAWKDGLIEMFCGQKPTLWTRWVSIGGSVGLEVRSSQGELIRHYGVARSDCVALGKS